MSALLINALGVELGAIACTQHAYSNFYQGILHAESVTPGEPT